MTIDRSRQGLSAELAFEYKSDAVTSDDGEDQVNATTLVSTDPDPCPTNRRALGPVRPHRYKYYQSHTKQKHPEMKPRHNRCYE